MECICGYSFAKALLQKPEAFKSYALIDDTQYRKFLRAEMKAVASKSVKDIARASTFVGSLHICPECGRVCVIWPDCEAPVSYLVPFDAGVDRKSENTGMTPSDFQDLSLGFPEATEAPHFEKTSFRVRKKIFATMAPEKAEAVLKLTPHDQAVFCGQGAGAVCPVKGKWGEGGWTAVDLEKVDTGLVKDALTCAYCTVAPKKLAELAARVG